MLSEVDIGRESTITQYGQEWERFIVMRVKAAGILWVDGSTDNPEVCYVKVMERSGMPGTINMTFSACFPVACGIK